MSIITRTKNAWNAFMGRDPTYNYRPNDFLTMGSYSYNPYRHRSRNSKSVVNAIYNQIAVDISNLNIMHVRTDEHGNYKETINDSLNEVLTLEANIDQSGRELIQDIVMSMFDEGCIAVVPYETSANPEVTSSFNIYKARVGRILEWTPRSILVDIYNEYTGQHENMWVGKDYTPIIENPFYEIMNEPNSVAQRLITTLNQIEDNNRRLGLIIQVPHSLRSEIRKSQVESRLREIESQLATSRHGVAYIDASEKIVQLNRPLDDVLWAQAKDLTEQLYNQLGMSKSIFDGTADDMARVNYTNGTLEPIANRITDNLTRKWISKTARAQGQTIKCFTDPFKFMPASQIAETADKFTRNEIMSSNEFRSVIGYRPSDDPKADMLINSNLNHSGEELQINNENQNDK